MKSWIMTVWQANHDQSEWPDMSIRQTEDACHVTDSEKHPAKDVIEKMCSDEFFEKHNYKYVEVSSGADEDEENEYVHPWFSKAERHSEANNNLVSNPVYQAAYGSHMSVERYDKFLAKNPAPKEPVDNESGYLCPALMEAEQHSDTERFSCYENTTEVVGCKRSHTEICHDKAVSRTTNEVAYSKGTKIKRSVIEYTNSAFTLDEDETSWHEDAESIIIYDSPPLAYQNVAYILDEGHCSQDEDTGVIAKHETCPEEYQNICMVSNFHQDGVTEEENTLACSYQNSEYFICRSSPGAKQTGPDQLVPKSDHQYANVQETMDVVTQEAVSRMGMETGQSHNESDYQEREALPKPNRTLDDISGRSGVPKSHSLLRSWLNDPQLEVIYYI